MSKKPLYGPMMETIKPYRERLLQAKTQLDEAWKGEPNLQSVAAGNQTNDVLELKESLSRVGNVMEFKRFHPKLNDFVG